jgi:hypothetical protein
VLRVGGEPDPDRFGGDARSVALRRFGEQVLARGGPLGARGSAEEQACG